MQFSTTPPFIKILGFVNRRKSSTDHLCQLGLWSVNSHSRRQKTRCRNSPCGLSY
jgi:hypothetical protein